MYGQNSVSANLPRILGEGAGEGGGVYIFHWHIFPGTEMYIYFPLDIYFFPYISREDGVYIYKGLSTYYVRVSQNGGFSENNAILAVSHYTS